MTLVVTHTTQTGAPADSTALVDGPAWDANHTLTGTVSAAQLNDSVVQAVTNDTNVTGSIATQNLTLGWTGTLAAARLNSNVVQAVTNDTNITGSITAQNLTFAWSGTLAVTRGGTGGGAASGTLLDNITGFSSTGILVRTASGTYAFRTLTGPAAGISVSNGNGVSGNPTLALANDLSALEALSGTNTIYYRSGVDTWSAVTVGGNLTFSAGTLNANIGGSTGSTDNAVLRADGTGGGTAQASALIVDDTTGRLSRSGNGGISIQGTNTNDSAAAGDVGEFGIATLAFASRTSLTTGTSKTVTSISIPAGDYDVTVRLHYEPAATTSVTRYISSLSATDNTLDQSSDRALFTNMAANVPTNTVTQLLTSTRLSLASTTTYYAVAQSTFTVSTMQVWGSIEYRRVR